MDAALFTLADQQPTVPPAGVIPVLRVPSRDPSISLGSRRLCNDQRYRPEPSPQDRVILNEYDRPVIACIEWRRVTFYREAGPKKPNDQPPEDQNANLTRGQFNGYMSPATRRKVRKIVSTWLRSIMLYRAEIKRRYDPGRAYPVFLTVTLPSDQVHSDSEINRRCLQPFIQQLKRQHGIEHYFWRAEAQENGRIHFHILTDRYVSKEDLQISWNKCVNVLGYVDRYYQQGHEDSPPSTEIHRVRTHVKDRQTGKMKEVDPVDYLLEYVMDAAQLEDQGPQDPGSEQGPRRLVGRYRAADGSIRTYYTRPIEGRVWGMADALRAIREPRAEASYRLIKALEDAKESGLLRRVDQEHATMYFGPVSLVIGRAHRGMWQLIKDYYINVFGYLYPAQLPKQYLADHALEDPVDLWIDLEHFATYKRLPEVIEEEQPRWDWSHDQTHISMFVEGRERHYYSPQWIARFPALLQEEPSKCPPGIEYWLE